MIGPPPLPTMVVVAKVLVAFAVNTRIVPGVRALKLPFTVTGAAKVVLADALVMTTLLNAEVPVMVPVAVCALAPEKVVVPVPKVVVPLLV